MMGYPRLFIHLYFHQTTFGIHSLMHRFCQESRFDTIYSSESSIGKIISPLDKQEEEGGDK